MIHRKRKRNVCTSECASSANGGGDAERDRGASSRSEAVGAADLERVSLLVEVQRDLRRIDLERAVADLFEDRGKSWVSVPRSQDEWAVDLQGR